MTSLATAQPQAVLAFDYLAEGYDDLFTKSLIGRAQRDVVWNVLNHTFRSGDYVLELNCGTGEDAMFLARNGVSVAAFDASEQMIRIASQRLRAEAPNARAIQSTANRADTRDSNRKTIRRCLLKLLGSQLCRGS
jgi:ubiquinone/menaquinone biosynthesis C-methylase UbiE